MEVGIKVIAENIQTHIVRHANSCFFTMVAVDHERRPIAVPPLRPFSAEEKRRFEDAILRKQLRQELARRFEEVKSA